MRLLVDVDGRRRNVGAQGGKTASGGAWQARFMCAHPPDAETAAALKVADMEIELPSVEFREPEPLPADELAASSGSAATGVEAGAAAGLVELLAKLESERAAADVARQRLARERRAAEEAEKQLTAAIRRRHNGGHSGQASHGGRGGSAEPVTVDATVVGYAVAAVIGLLFVLLLLLLV